MALLTLEDFFSIPIFFFKCVGLRPIHRGGREPLKYKYVNLMQFIFWFSLLSLGVALVGECAYIYHGVTCGQDFLNIISCLACTLYGAMCWENLFTVWRKCEEITKLVEFLQEEFPKTIEEQEKLRMTKLKKESWAFMTSFAIVFIFLISSFNFSPVVVNILEVYLGHSKWNADFPFTLWYPFDPASSTTLYVGLYLWLVWAGFTAVLSGLAMSLFLGALVTQFCLQLKRLNLMLQETLNVPSRNNPPKGVLLLRDFVIKHNEIISYCMEMEDIFSMSLFYHYIMSSVNLCLGLFMVIAGVKWEDFIKFCLFLISCLLQTLTISHFGQYIIDNVSYLIYLIVFYN